MNLESDQISRKRVIAAPVANVWAALTDHRQFGAWFGVALDQPFAVNQLSTGKMTVPGAEGLPWLAQVVDITPMQRFAFRWHVYDAQSNTPLDQQPLTLVTFTLASCSQGTQLRVTESEFDKVGADRRGDIMRDNANGWAIQTDNLAQAVES